MTDERPCKYCNQPKQDHTTLRYKCDIDKLPLPWQQELYTSDLATWPNYEPMDNLEYLEYECREENI